jgi:hypothetical protein
MIALREKGWRGKFNAEHICGGVTWPHAISAKNSIGAPRINGIFRSSFDLTNCMEVLHQNTNFYKNDFSIFKSKKFPLLRHNTKYSIYLSPVIFFILAY